MSYLSSKNLFSVAEKSLRANIMELPSGKFLAAGQHQYKTLWTRDFCHAVRGLIAIGETETAKSHLSFLFKNLRDDGLAPRVMDNHIVQLRVAWQCFRQVMPFLPEFSFKEPLGFQYKDEHGSNAIDSNLLAILATLQLEDEFFQQHEAELHRMWNWYEDKFRDGLIYQTSFSDWQDTCKRTGFNFLTNLFYYLAGRRLEKFGWKMNMNLAELSQRIKATFWDGQVYKATVGYDIVSIEGNLFALESDEFLNSDEKKTLWENLKKHPIVSLDGVIGRCSFPDWPDEDLAWQIKFTGLQRYHGSISWSWLIGLGLSVCLKMNDQEMIEKQMKHIEQLLLRDGEVYEIFDPDKNFLPWQSRVFRSEHPFAWGSGYLAHALHEMAKR